jgi:hypothetical protein
MMGVVFTGPAVDNAGRSITRAALTSACAKAGGFEVQPSIRVSTHLLVASRKDTVKAKRAAERGLPVLTYPEFINHYLKEVPIESVGTFNPWTDKKVDQDLLVPDFTEGLSDGDIL